MKFHRSTSWLVPLLVIVTFPLWSIPVGNFLAPRGGFDAASKDRIDTRNFNMNRVMILQNQQGKKTAVIRADKAHTGKDPNLVIMEQAMADLFDDDGNVTKVVARTGEYSLTTKVLTLIGDVVINRTRDKQLLYTDLLRYDSQLRRIHCPGKTRMKGDKVEIDGGGLDYDITSKTYVIDKRVKCIINGFVEP